MEERTSDKQWLVGVTLGERYRVDEVLAQGALCAVYGGEDTGLSRPIAVKAVPAAHIAAYRAALAATTTLAHSAAVIVLDAVERDSWLFLIQERVRGTALAELLDGGYSPDLAVGMGLQLARLLAYAHGRGTVHGDLTPAAVMVEREHIIRVNNFCLPPDTAYFDQFADVGARLMRGLSLPGAALAEGEGMPAPATPEADIYALGLLLWQALATTRPNGHARDFRADVPAAVRDLVGRILVPTHPQRLTSAVELLPVLEAAQALLAGREQELQPTPPLLWQVRQARQQEDAAQAWSQEETIVNPSSQPLYPGYSGYPGYPAGYPLDATRPAIPAVPSGPLRAPVRSGSLSGPPQPPPPAVYRSSLSGPLRLANPAGPLRTRQLDGAPPAPPPGAPGAPRQANVTRRLPAINTGPHPDAPTPQRAPTLSGPLPGPLSGPPRATTSGRVGDTGQVPAYRPPAALPWREDPQVAEWAGARSRPNPARMGPRTGQSWPAAPRREPGLGLLPGLLVGLVILVVCFIVGFLLPYILPFH